MRRYVMLLFGILRLLKEKLWNTKNLQLNGIKYYVGKGTRFNTNHNSIYLGVKTWISENSYFSANGGDLYVGHNNYFNANIRIISKAGITIGDNNLFGPNIVIVDHGHAYTDPNCLICKQGYTRKNITIGSDNWFGANVCICEGVTVGNHIVVGANSVVTRDLLEPGLYVGAPAKLIKKV